MERTISVVYEDGVFKPLELIALEEGTKFQFTIIQELNQPKKRKLDLVPGAFQIPDGFDDPLRDEFWLGEEE